MLDPRLALGVIGSALIAMPFAAAPSSAQTPAPAYIPTSLQAEPDLPRTPDGHPDFQGVVWKTDFFPIMQAGPDALPLIVGEEEAKAILAAEIDPILSGTFVIDETRRVVGASRGLPVVRGERRSRLLVLPPDGQLPYTADARKELAADDPATYDNPEERPAMERCLLMHAAPPISSPLLAYQRFVQTSDHVVIHTEEGDETRIIPLATNHGPAAVKPPLGDSIARWNGDTLVIETTNLPDKIRVRGVPRFIVSAEAIVIERYTRLSNDELLYQYTVIDPKVYAAPWLAEHSLYRTGEQMYPWACHETNYSLPGILAGGQRKARESAG